MPRPPCPYLGRRRDGSTGAPTPSYSYEFFPPLTQPGTLNLHDRIIRLASLQPGPAAISITWGAGGSTSERSLGLAEFVTRNVKGTEAIMHLTCTNMEREKVVEALETAKSLGIKNILALRGDPPRESEYLPTSPTPSNPGHSQADSFTYAIDLVRFIRANYGDDFCIGVAGYPDPHPDSATEDEDVEFLKAKVDAGADYIVTQLFYDVDIFLRWKARCRAAGVKVPIIPGVMPIQNYASFRRMTALCKASVPLSILTALEPIKTDDNLVKQFGIDLAIAMVERLVGEGEVEGVHFCTLNLERSVRRVLEGLTWLAKEPTAAAAGSNGPDGPSSRTHGGAPLEEMKNMFIQQDGRSFLPSAPAAAFTISSAAASLAAAAGLHHTHHAEVSQPTAPAGDASWDEFPNGRFTDVRSPAYGELDGYGGGLKILPNEALTHWGRPTATADISAIFTSYLQSRIPSIPWCTTPLDAESRAILPLLLSLNANKGWWTVGSQPAVDGIPSEDEVYGFGPRGGYVFQKAFVEFFVTEEVVNALAAKADSSNGIITFYAGNKRGDFRTNMAQEDVNAVTWAVFPGKEIVQSTIIEEVSFVSWKEEAFSVWEDWSFLYPPRSAPRELLQSIADDYWLVSVVCHDYKNPAGLSDFLLGA